MKFEVWKLVILCLDKTIMNHLLYSQKLYFLLQVLALQGDKEEVTRLASSPGHSHLAVGYNDGSIKVFDLATGELQVTFNGHKSAVTALNYDQDGVRLVSGSKVGLLDNCLSSQYWLVG